MARDLGELNREDYARYKDDVKKEGSRSSRPRSWHDTVMSLVVVCVIVALAAIWYYSADGVEPGLLGPWYTEPADPGTTTSSPRPDWYFYFLFYLLRIFKWPETVFIATVGIPTICLILLSIGLPFYDRRSERRPTRCPIAMVAAVLYDPVDGRADWKGDREGGAGLGARCSRARNGPRNRGFAGNDPEAERGDTIRAGGCLNCHTYLGQGAGNLGARRPLVDRGDQRRCVLRLVPHDPGGVREHGDEVVLVPRGGEPLCLGAVPPKGAVATQGSTRSRGIRREIKHARSVVPDAAFRVLCE